MKSLIVEDDSVSQRIMEAYLSPYGKCDIAGNGLIGLEKFKIAFDNGDSYDLISLDIMMPKMSGHEALRLIREYENHYGIYGGECVKIIMTTALDDSKNINEAFRNQCEAYLIKPVSYTKIIETLKNMDLIDEPIE